jgi:magnesium chelatase family protein
MSIARCHSVALQGLDGHVVEVEAHLADGLPGLSIIGLPDASLSEARDRVKAAVQNTGFSWPQKRITLGLSPASLRKGGSGFDLALAAALLAAAEEVPEGSLEGLVLLGELGLDGRVRPVPGVLPAMVAASQRPELQSFVVPAVNLAEARLLSEVTSRGVRSLAELVRLLRGEQLPDPEVEVPTATAVVDSRDFADVLGQPVGRTACEVAAAGGHNLFFTGPPGCGKTLLAERLPGILPALSFEESLEVSQIHSVAGILAPDAPLVTRPPFQAPHHGATAVSVVGGGTGVARPGAASLAHRGVLFLDEAPEFQRAALDGLRQPLESGEICIRRVGGTARYPARFALVLAANPCPCAKPRFSCTCRPSVREGYLAKLSGPLLDRIDLHVALGPITRREMASDRGNGETTQVIAERVAAARVRAAARYAGTPWRTNADVPPSVLVRRWPLGREPLSLLGRAMDEGFLTARGFGRVQRLAWTLADLAGSPAPTLDDAKLALSLRLGDKVVQGFLPGVARLTA